MATEQPPRFPAFRVIAQAFDKLIGNGNHNENKTATTSSATPNANP